MAFSGLVVGAIFWSFLRRASKRGVSPLEVDRLEAPHLPEPEDPAELPVVTDVPDEKARFTQGFRFADGKFRFRPAWAEIAKKRVEEGE